MSDTFTWECPHCGHSQTGAYRNNKSDQWIPDFPETSLGPVGTLNHMRICLNGDCKKVSFTVYLYAQGKDGAGDTVLKGKPLETWRLIPESSAKPQPDSVPKPLQDDYFEACRIRDLSPKASATLARRCLQGMIRNFCGITKPTLKAEIEALDSLVQEGKEPRGVTPESVKAIDNVRGVGNIGAHMEKDINLIVDIDPGEAQVLIELIETLFDEWYVARDERTKRFEKIATLAAEKANEKKGGA